VSEETADGKPEDFQAYWDEVLQEVREYAPAVEILPWEREDPRFEGEYLIGGAIPATPRPGPAPNPFDYRWDSRAIVTGLVVRKVLFRSTDGQKVGGLLQYPRAGEGRRYPCIVHFTGYGGELMLDCDFVSSGYAVFNFSHRGMLLGSEGFDRYHPVPLLVRGVEDRRAYAYRAALIDCLLAVKVAGGLEVVDGRRMAAMGTSQGGGLTIMAGALDGGLRCLSADLPWLTDFHYQLTHPVEGPYRELAEYIRRHPGSEPAVRRTLGYFDTLHFADRLRQPVLVSLGLQDAVCAPASVRRLFERIPTTKLLLELPNIAHERSTTWRYLTARWFDYYL
jgi:cephalosporin-C deacetylase